MTGDLRGIAAVSDLNLGKHMEFREDCLGEASECDRLAQLANTQGTRTLVGRGGVPMAKVGGKSSRTAKAFLATGAGCGADELARRRNRTQGLVSGVQTPS
jgi:hypothetical protein